MKIIPLLIACSFGGFSMTAPASAAVLVNDASIFDVRWAEEDLDNWTTQTATGANGLSITGGHLVLDNTAATTGTTNVSAASIPSPLPQSFIYTVRTNVAEFPTGANTNNSAYLARLRLPGGGTRRNYLGVAVHANQILVINNTLYTAIPIATAEDTFYTWQFQVTMSAADSADDPAAAPRPQASSFFQCLTTHRPPPHKGSSIRNTSKWE